MKKYGRLTIITNDFKTQDMILVLCVCGKTKKVYANNVLTGKTQSCGCLREERLLIANQNRDKFGKKNPCYRHGLSGTPFYNVFNGIYGRCNTPSNTSYNRYGAKGVECLWGSFLEFKRDMYDGYLDHKKNHPGRNTTIDRIDSSGHYCKENCRWVTYVENMRNKKSCYA